MKLKWKISPDYPKNQRTHPIDKDGKVKSAYFGLMSKCRMMAVFCQFEYRNELFILHILTTFGDNFTDLWVTNEH